MRTAGITVLRRANGLHLRRCDPQDRLATWRRAAALPTGAPAGPVLRAVRERLADDLDSPGAIAAVDAWARATLDGADDDAGAPALARDTVDALLGVSL